MKLLNVQTERSALNQAMEVIGIVLLLLMVVLPLYYFNQLPETVPIHYSAGKPDGYGDRTWIFVLAVIGWILYIGLSALARHLPVFYDPGRVSREVAEEQRRAFIGAIRALKVAIAGVFCYLVYQTIRVALGEANGLHDSLLPVLWWTMFAITGFFVYRAIRLQLRIPDQP